MNRLIAIIIAIMIVKIASAQSPEKISYQAVIRNIDNQLVTNQSIGMRISIIQGSASGTVIYTETQTPTTNTNGLVTIEIGGGTDFNEIDWANGTYFIKTETDPTGNTAYSITGTIQILSVPYALYAKNSGNGFSGDYNDLSNIPSFLDSINSKAVLLTGDQIIEGNKTFTGTLSANDNIITAIATPINPTDAVNKAYVDALEQKINKLDNTLIAGGYVIDYDGNYYNTVKIGNQLWMSENLKTTHYSDGEPIPNVTDPPTWINLTTGAYCWYNNDALQYKDTYGALYNWYAVSDSNNLCPTGWHMPTDAEWATLSLYIDSTAIDSIVEESIIAGNVLKSTTGWNYDGSGTDAVGFTALPGGYCARLDGIFYGSGERGHWWTINESTFPDAWNRNIYYYDSSIMRGSYNKAGGLSVRCVKNSN